MIANYGNKKTYMVQDINFDLTPCSTFFTLQDGSKMSVAKYFKKEYNLVISDKKQPMLIMRQGGKGCFVPPEFCILDGVPDQIRSNNREMRELLSKTRQDPSQKIQSVQKMIAQLFNSEKCKQWGITFDNDPIELKSRKLAAPALLAADGSTKSVKASDQSLKREPVLNSKPLSKIKILLVH